MKKAFLLPLVIALFTVSLNARSYIPNVSMQQCTADFSFPASGNCLGQGIPLTDMSYVAASGSGYIMTWVWEFGDGTMEVINYPSSPNITHVYTSGAGTYMVTLTITGSLGCTDFKSKPVTLSPAPTADFIFPSTDICLGQAVQFTDQTQTNGGGIIVSFNWNFGDGSPPSCLQNPVHVYAAPGIYTVTFSVINVNGCPAAISKIVTINPLPAAMITPNGPVSFCEGNSVTLTAGLANAFLWSNGATTQSITVSIPGSYSVTVTNGTGCVAASSPTIVTVLPKPVANAGTDQSISYGASAALSGSATNGSGNYSWHWEPASLLVNPNVQNPVTAGLTSSVQYTLTVTDLMNGCMGNDQVLVSVTGGPLSVNVTATPNTSCPGSAVQLMAIVSGGTGNNTYSWTSNPIGFAATTNNSTAYPVVPTTYTVAVNDGFANVSDSIFVTITTTGTGIDPYQNLPLIYPNPTMGKVYISLAGRSRISIFNMEGILVRSVEDFISGSLDLREYTGGIYVIRIESPGRPMIQKKVVIL